MEINDGFQHLVDGSSPLGTELGWFWPDADGVLNAYAFEVTSGGVSQTVTAQTGHISLSGKAASVLRSDHHTVSAVTGHLTITGKQASVARTEGKSIAVQTGHLALSGKLSSILRTAHQTVSAGTAHVVLTGKAMSVLRTANQIVLTQTGRLQFTGKSMSVGQTTSGGIMVQTGHLLLSGKSMAVMQTQHRIVQAGTGHAVLSGKQASVAQSAHRRIEAQCGHITLSGKQMSVAKSFNLSLSLEQAINLECVARARGLVTPLTVSSNGRGDGQFEQVFAGTSPITVTTQVKPATAAALDTALLDKLSRWYGLIDPMVEQDASRSDGTLAQTVVKVGETTTVTTL